MLDDSLFVSADLHEREVQVGKNKKVKLHFRELPAVDFMRFNSSVLSSDDDVKAAAIAKLIAACVCNPDGTPAISYEKALTLKTIPMTAIFIAVREVNGSDSGNG